MDYREGQTDRQTERRTDGQTGGRCQSSVPLIPTTSAAAACLQYEPQMGSAAATGIMTPHPHRRRDTEADRDVHVNTMLASGAV